MEGGKEGEIDILFTTGARNYSKRGAHNQSSCLAARCRNSRMYSLWTSWSDFCPRSVSVW